MAKTIQVINFSGSASSGRPFALQQQDWPTANPANFGAWLKANGHDKPSVSQIIWLYELYKGSCRGDGALVATLRVRLLDLATPYVLRASWGQVGSAVLAVETRQEFLAFELDTAKEIDFGRITAAVWNGEVWDADGDQISAPAVTLSGRAATVPQAVHGVLECTVVEELYTHSLTISPREMTAEQAQRYQDGENIHPELYASTAMLFCNAQIDLVEINMPENFGTCSGGYSTGGTGNDDDDEDDQETRYYQVAFEVLDHCTGAPIPNATVRVDGVLIISQGEWVAPGNIWPEGEHTIEVEAPGYLSSSDDDIEGNETFALGSSGSQSNAA